jgi:hypothetical protein
MDDRKELAQCRRGVLREPSRRADATHADSWDLRIAVAEVLDAWLAPEYRYFKLRGADGDTYLVRHDERSDIWELTMFRAERFRPAT